MGPAFCFIKLRGRHHLFRSFFQVLGRNIFHVGSNAPQMSERVLDEARAVSVELVLNRLQDFCSFGDRAFNDGIHIRNV